MPIKLNTASGGGVILTGANTASDKTITVPADDGTMIYANSSGNVGIGTSSPGFKLEVVGGTNNGIHIKDAASATVYGGLFTQSASLGLYARSNHALTFGTNDTERARIDSSGNLLIADTVTTSGARLVVKKANSERVIHVENTQNQSGDQTYRSVLGTNCNNTVSYHFVASTGSDKCYIYGNGNIVNSNNSYGALSDISIKENVVDATPKLADIMQVRIRNYNLKYDENKTKQIGVVAQELEEVFPSMIETDGISGYKQVKYSVFVPMLVKAIQEQQQIIETLQAKVAALEAK